MKLIDILTPDRNCLPTIILKYFKDQNVHAASFCFLFFVGALSECGQRQKSYRYVSAGSLNSVCKQNQTKTYGSENMLRCQQAMTAHIQTARQ